MLNDLVQGEQRDFGIKMFTVIPKSHLPEGIHLVHSGSLFGRWGTPITFTLTSRAVPRPFDLRFDILHDKGGPKIEAGEFGDQQMTTRLYVTSKEVPTYSLSRARLVYLDASQLQLTFSFALHPYEKSEFFTFIYEFYEEPYNDASEAEKAKGSVV